MGKDNIDTISAGGQVVECLPNATFKVQLENGHQVLASLAGKMRTNRIRVALGDKVDIEISTYDFTRGRIVYRHR